ncbi:MAG TPA: MFS transporter [Spirochaetia bacterium]|nr:MFS transporter [Spirochaetia bacterium]
MKHRSPGDGTAPLSGAANPRLSILMSAIGKQWVILPSTLAVSTAVGIATIGLLFYVRDVFGAPPALVSVFAATWTATYAFSCIALRRLSMRLLPRHSLILAAATMAVSLALIPLFNSLALAFLLYACFGTAVSFFWPPLMGWLSAGLEQRALSSIIGRYNLSWSTGTIISPFLGGLLYQSGSLLPLFVSIALLGATALFIAAASVGLPRIKSDLHREARQIRGERSGAENSTPLRFPARFAVFGTYFAFGIILNVLPLYLRDHLGMTESDAGLFLLIRAASTTLGFVLLGRRTFWHFKKWWILGGQILVLLLAFLFSLLHETFALAVGVALFGAGMAIVYNNSVFHGISGSRSRASRMAVHESTLTAGVVVGSMVGGPIYQAYSINAAFLVAAAVCLFSAIVMTILLVRVRTV